MVPHWARRLQGDRGQAWPSCALTLHGCPLTLWVGGPPHLSLTLPEPTLFFVLLFFPYNLWVSLTCCLSNALGINFSLYFTRLFFSIYLFVSWFYFCYYHFWSIAKLTCLEGKQPPPLSWSLCLSISLFHRPSLPILCPSVVLEGSIYPAAAEAGFSCPWASLWKGIFCLWRIAHSPWWHWALNCTTSKFGSLFL